jgi:hypothetical protein
MAKPKNPDLKKILVPDCVRVVLVRKPPVKRVRGASLPPNQILCLLRRCWRLGRYSQTKFADSRSSKPNGLFSSKSEAVRQ